MKERLRNIGSYGIKRVILIYAIKKTKEENHLEVEGRKLSMSKTQLLPHNITLKALLSRRICGKHN
eukprot:4557036-Heterocapsa_arctica.AAC.1